MSFTITTDVFCDICSDWHFGVASNVIEKRRAWELVERIGWTKVDGLHVCPVCNGKVTHRSPNYGYAYKE